MKLQGSRVLLTGAGGGIGRSLALELGSKGANLALVGRDVAKLQKIAKEIDGGRAHIFEFDVSSQGGQEELVRKVSGVLGGLDVLINNAGISSFSDFSAQDPAEIDRLLRTNFAGPVLLSRAVLPLFIRRNSGKIVNVGSAFGAIGFGHFSVYCATKFAMRGFSESLRRELDHTEIGVIHVAPRATRTPLNEEPVVELNRRTGVRTDEPEVVAKRIVKAIERDERDCYIGWPESVFVRLNAIFPRLIDKALKKNNGIARGLLKR